MHRRTIAGVAAGALVVLAAAAPAPARKAPEKGAGAVKEFTVIAERFKFTPSRVEVTQGDTVRMTVRSADVTHGLQVKEFDIDLIAKRGGKPETSEFVAERAGTFEIACSEYCGKSHDEMKGMLVVHPRGDQ